MGIIAPLALALLALGLPIIVLYMLRLRRPAAPVSSILLWEAVLTDLEANAPWQRLRRNWLLILQLLILIVLVLALARPFHTSAGGATGNAIVILDASASMRATDVAPNRFERARAEARGLVDRLGADQRMAIILAGDVAEVVQAPTADRSALHAALDRAQPGHGLLNLPDAIALATAAGQRLPDSQVIIISDGAFGALDPATVTLPTRVLTVGAGADNLAITALATRSIAGRPSLFARVRNTGPSAQRGLLSIYADERLIDARAIALDGGAETGVTVDTLPPATGVVRAELDTRDALAEDNRAWVVPGASGATRILLVAPDNNGFLRRGLALLPAVSLFQTAEPNPEPGYDWYVFDGLAPDRLPGSSLLLDPPAGNPLLPVTGQLDRPRVTRVARDHPLLANLDLSRLNIARAAAIDPPAWAQVLVESDGAPLLLAGERAGQRVAVLAFDLHQSDLPLQLAFPILLDNLQRWLQPAADLGAGSAADGVIRPGDLVTLRPGLDVDEVAVILPDGRQQTLPLVDGVARLVDTALPGPYQISLRHGGVERRVTWAAVNLLSDDESAITPVAHPPLGAAPASPAAPPEPARQELWRPLLLLGILLLLAEWWLFYRGAHRPTLRVIRHPR